MQNPNTTEFQRLHYWQGQMLRSQDFSDQFAIEAQIRWWHNRALHNTFGVKDGLKTFLVVDSKTQEQKVRITPGLAYDCFGRELILQSAFKKALPPVSADEEDTFTLLIRYKDISYYSKQSEFPEICNISESSMFQEVPEFVWKASRRVIVTDGVPLARLIYDGDNSPSLEEGFIALGSRPLARPRVASGTTIPGKTFWELWTELVNNKPLPLGFQVKIDTGAAGFTTVPCYFAWLQGPFWDKISGGFLFVPFPHITEASINGFSFRLRLPHIAFPFIPGKVMYTNENFESEFVAFAQQQELYVSWLGIQAIDKTDINTELNHGKTK